VNTKILEKYAASIFKVEVIRMRMWPGYVKGDMEGGYSELWDGKNRKTPVKSIGK
jgi:hypothetical protein